MSTVELRTVLERKDPRLTVFFVVPADRLRRWELDGTVIVEGAVNGCPMGRLTLKKWDDGRWFIELTASFCKKLGLAARDEFVVRITLADSSLPAELDTALGPTLRAAWDALSLAVRRQLMEQVRSAKAETIRLRRAKAIATKLGGG